MSPELTATVEMLTCDDFELFAQDEWLIFVDFDTSSESAETDIFDRFESLGETELFTSVDSDDFSISDVFIEFEIIDTTSD
jgi:hypothetical protein